MSVMEEQIRYNEQGLVPAILQEQATGTVLMMAWMNREALEKTLETGEAWFWSRSRQALWHKGGTSGNVQRVEGLAPDCDGDTLLVQVTPAGPACHTGSWSCFGEPPERKDIISRLAARIRQRQLALPEGLTPPISFRRVWTRSSRRWERRPVRSSLPPRTGMPANWFTKRQIWCTTFWCCWRSRGCLRRRWRRNWNGVMPDSGAGVHGRTPVFLLFQGGGASRGPQEAYTGGENTGRDRTAEAVTVPSAAEGFGRDDSIRGCGRQQRRTPCRTGRGS